METYAQWHRTPCEITDWLVVSGDLHPDVDVAVEQLRAWQALGITDVIDVRLEYSDEKYVREHAPEMRYHYLPTDDRGQKQQDEWFDRALEIAQDVREREGRCMVHCHLGVQRAPSLAFRLLIEEGMEPIEALNLIRKRRPVAGIGYAHDAIEHFLKARKASRREIDSWLDRIRRWYASEDIDLRTVIRAMRVSRDYGN